MTLPTLQERGGPLSGFMQGLGMGTQQSLASISDLIMSAKQQQAKRDAYREKIPLKAASWLKNFHRDIYDIESERGEVALGAQKYFDEGFGETDSLEQAVKDYRASRKKKGKADEERSNPWLSSILGPLANQGPVRDFLTKERGETGDEQQSDLMRGLGLASNPKTMIKELPVAGAQALENAPFTPIPALLRLAQQKGVGLTPRELLGKQAEAGKEKYFEKPSDILKKKTREGLSPEEARAAEATANGEEALLGLFLPNLINKLIGPKAAKAIFPDEILPSEKALIEQKPKQLSSQAPIMPNPKTPKSAPVTKVQPPKLEGRVTKVPETPTELRMERVNPEARIYPRLENVKLREIQLKNHPKYVEEITTDAAERAARAEARIPKTVKGMQSKQIRVHEAEKNWPMVQESYNKAAGRVRALEDEVVKLSGEARESGETLLELAKKELDDATFDLKQAWENLEGTNYRATVKEMRDAARKKMLDIQDAVSEGNEYKIAKRDYSPDLISKATAISKSKKLPSARQSDFYTQVHDVYANEYKNRVAQIDKELGELPKTMAGLHQARQLQQEKDILNKMVKSAEAEKAIQNRRFALREMSERHKAQERFKKLERTEGKSEVSKVAQEKMWKQRFEEAKTPEQRAAAIDEGIEQIVNEHPEQAAKIRAEGNKLKESVEDLFRTREAKAPPSAKGEKTRFREESKKSPAPPKKAREPIPSKEDLKQAGSPSEAVKLAKTQWQKYLHQFDMLKKSFPYIWKVPMGRDLITGVFLAFYEESRKGTEFPISGWQLASVLGHPRGSPIRAMANTITRWAIKEWKVGFAEKALREKETEKFSSYSKQTQKKAKERVYSR